MEKKEPIRVSLPVFIAILVLLVATIFGIYMFKQNKKLENVIASVKQQMDQTQIEKNEAINKLNNITNIATTTEKENSEKSNSNEQEKKSNDSIKLRYGEFYDLLSAINGYIMHQEGDNVSGQVCFNDNGKVFIAYDVVRSFEGTYTVSEDTITCKLTSITNEGEKEKDCNYTVKYKLLHTNGLELLSSDLKYKDSNVYSNGDLLVCYR